MSQRVVDVNGWFEVKRNPLSRVGVFPYSGKSVGLTGQDADRIVRVYRPAEELSDPECLASFKLLPWVDEHAMLGDPDAVAAPVIPAEAKGVQGVIGENVVFDGGVLYGNIKAFSNSMGRLIEAGKRQLSAGYRCVYDFTPGVFKGQAYDVVQRKIRGNHLALVSEGRMGPSVAVLDHMKFTFDAQEAIPMADPTQTPPGGDPANPNAGVDPNNPAARLTLAEIGAIMKAVVPMLTDLQGALGKLHTGGAGAVPGAAPGVNQDPTNPHPNLDPKAAPAQGQGPNPNQPKVPNPEDENAMDEALKKQVEGLQTAVDGLTKTVATAVAAMDAAVKAAPTVASLGAETAQRDALADRLGAVVGTFDAKDKTLQAVAEYGVEKLGLKTVTKGLEIATVDAYLQGIEKAADGRTIRVPAAAATGLDAAPAPVNFVTRHLSPAPAAAAK